MMIFSKRWHGIKGETVGEGKFAMSVVRVQTSKDGPWQALTDKELEQLLAEHNQVLYNNEAKVPVKPVIIDAKDIKSDRFAGAPKKAKKKGKKK